jgi:adenosylhomocysteine nucleosidase
VAEERARGGIVVLISAGTEWRMVRAYFPDAEPQPSPYGESLTVTLQLKGGEEEILLLHGGWGKIAAAGSTQYAIDRWSPSLLVNLGTCGGFEGAVEPGAVLLAERTLVYDIIEQMGDPAEALDHYATPLDLAWLEEPLPQPVVRGLLLSADRDLVAEEVEDLQARYGAVAADWESGAIAYVAARNGVPTLILRGVTDLVGPAGGEAYDGTLALFTERTRLVMQRLLEALPAWLERRR